MEEIKNIVLASSNRGKIRELSDLLLPLGIKVSSQFDYDVKAVEETGLTFVENALLKARHASKITQLPAIADDSGLVVDALHGAPGIFSARYAGKNSTDVDNYQKVLTELAAFPEDEKRVARFISVIVFLRHEKDPSPIICQGIWQGRILLTPRGEQGFGYDPIFYVPTHHCSAAELDIVEKNRISHRGQAMKKLLEDMMG